MQNKTILTGIIFGDKPDHESLSSKQVS